MSPRHKPFTLPKDKVAENQPAFISAKETLGDFGGLRKVVGEVTLDGSFPADEVLQPSAPKELTPEEIVFSQRVKETVLKDKHRHDQLGSHSAIGNSPNGTYEGGTRPGMWLPGFGVVTYANRVKAIDFARQLDVERRTTNVDASEEMPLLESRQRLAVLRDDPRARFLPSTDTEKTTAFTILDAKKRSDVHKYFNETRRKQYKEAETQGMSKTEARLYAQDAFRSRLHEAGDFLVSAMMDKIALEALDRQVNAIVNPSLRLTEAIGVSHPGYAPFVRYLDGIALRDEGEEFAFNPLRPVEDRPAKNFDGQHKVIDDPYTTQHFESENVQLAQAHTAAVIDTETIGSLRSAVRTPEGNFITRLDEAIENQERRQAFWVNVLRSFNGKDAELAQDILKTLGLNK